MISPFALHQPDSPESACSLLSKYGEDARILAGGSELIFLLKLGLVNVRALVTHRAIERSETVREHLPLLVEMESQVANIRIRNVGTLAGNLCFAEPHADPGTLLVAYQAKVKAHNTRGERTINVSDFFVDYYQNALAEDEILTEVEIPKLGPNFSTTYLRFCPGERPTAAVALVMDWNSEGCENLRLVLGCSSGCNH